ncbi:carboxymuconolactone decarboxylase family protein [Gordonia sp. CPCC 205515]|uniref:carboxymuconolactone decarboxylase family protein n=1 Tax=Gordonia sp. CPCC 205515 TaxID=3140791 RepID=UPI003AF40B22
MSTTTTDRPELPDGLPDTRRMWLPRTNPGVYKALVALQRASSEDVEPELGELIKIRASQLNHCAYCLHMHVSDAVALGVDPLLLSMVAVWREATHLFTERQCAALELTDHVTRLGERGVPDDVFARARTQFDEAELGRVLASIVMINAWNRIAIAGSYPAGLDERQLRS